MTSLRTRLMAATTGAIAIFVALAGAGLETAFRNSAREAEQDKLQGLVYSLLGDAEAAPDGSLTIPTGALNEPRLNHVDAHFFALIFNDHGRVVWHSPSFSGVVPTLVAPEVGEMAMREVDRRFALTYGVRWAADSLSAPGGAKPHSRRYTIAVLEDMNNYEDQLATFRKTLWVALGIAISSLIVLQFLVLRWGLAPLRKMADEVKAVENARQQQIEAVYPLELEPLVGGLNTMIRSERNQQTRYRNALGDLAHSIKTPLAALRGLADNLPPELPGRVDIDDQLQRLQDITEYQLKRANTAGRRAMSEPVPARQIVDKTLAALTKVYAEKQIRYVNRLPQAMRLRMDSGDLYELLGNLLDNASKWCRSQVRIEGHMEGGDLILEVEDDGPGFPDQPEKLLMRGVRADSLTPGQGIGLATVADIVELHNGRIVLDRGGLGGARVRVIIGSIHGRPFSS